MELPVETCDNGGLRIAFDCFDTANFITVYGHNASEELLHEAKDLCLTLHELLNFTDPASDIAKINAAGCERVDVNKHTSSLLAAAKHVSSAEAQFDITIGPVTRLWKHTHTLPSEHAVQEALKHIGIDKLEIGEGWVKKDDAALRVDVGGIAKGYAADLLAQMMRNVCVESADVDLGGNLYLLGEHPEGRAWRIESDLPEGFACRSPRFLVADASVSTSSNFLRAEVIEGREYGHIIDVTCGYPVQTDIAMASVISTSSLKADALSTVLLSGGSDGFEHLAARHVDCCFVAVTKQGECLSANFPNEHAYLVR